MKKLNKVEQKEVVGGIGYRWKCATCPYTSAWHGTKSSAQSNADAHTKLYGHKTAVYSA